MFCTLLAYLRHYWGPGAKLGSFCSVLSFLLALEVIPSITFNTASPLILQSDATCQLH